MLIIALVFISGCNDGTTPPLPEKDDIDSVTPLAMRDLPDECVEPGEEFDVSITVSDYGLFGVLDEELCDDWIYINSSLTSEQVEVANKSIKFVLFGESSFSYTVRAPSEQSGPCTIKGTLKDLDKVEYSVEGDSQICIL